MWSSVVVRRFAAFCCFASLRHLIHPVPFSLKLAPQQALAVLVGVLAIWIAASAPSRADNSQYFYDPAGRLTGVIDPVNGSAQYSYDAVGNIVSVVRRATTDLFVAQVSPSGGRPGDVVTIFGTGFDTAADTSVSFNGVAATPIAVSATQITVTVPSGAVSGPIGVTSPAGTMASAASFTVLTPAPTIAGFSPSQIDAGGTLTITGSDFDVAANDKVLVNGNFAPVMSASASSLSVRVMAPSSGRVVVSTPSGTATSNGYLAVAPVGELASNIGSVATSSIGSSATVNIGSGQFGLILFDAAVGQRVPLQVTSSSLSGGMQLYGPDGGAVGSSFGFSNGTFNAGQTLARSGTYTLLVWSSSAGSATINLINAPDVVGTIAADATPVSLTTTAPGQAMVLTFSGTAGQRVSLITQSSNYGGCPSLVIEAPGGGIPFSNGCADNMFSGVVILPVSGIYTIRIAQSGPTVGTEKFTLYTVPPDVTGTIAADATPVSLTTATPGQHMSLTFSGTAGQRVSLITQSSNYGGCPVLVILEPDGTTQLYRNGCADNMFSGVLNLPVSGTYTLSLTQPGPTVGTENFTMYTVPPDVTGTIAADATPVSLTTTTPGQHMSLTFSGTAGQRVSLITQSNNYGGCPSLVIVEPDGATQLYSNGCGDNMFSGVLLLPITGAYTIQLTQRGATVGTENFTLYNEPANASATITPGGGTVSLTTTTPGQSMVLTFSGTSGQRVSLLTQSNNYGGCPSLVIVEPDGTTQLYSNGCGDNMFSGALTLPTTGTYSIQLAQHGATTGTENFTLYSVPPDVTGTATIGSASNYATTAPGQAIDVSFAGTANGNATVLVNVVSTTPSNPCYTITTLEPDGQTRLRSDQSCNSGYSSGSLGLPTSGTYTIIVAPTSTTIGTFSIEVTSP
jgi:YD repeat-containing protein